MEPEHQGIEEPEATESGWWRLQGIFFEPAETFRQIARKPNILLPLAAVIVVGLATTFFVVNQIGFETIIRQQITQSPQVQDMSSEQREELISTQVNSPVIRTLTYAGPIFGVIVMVGIAGLLLLGIRLFDSEGTYAQVLSVTCHSYFASGVINGILICLVVAVTSDKSTIDVRDAVMSHLGFLVDKFDSPVMYSLASSFDLVTFYVMYLLALGLSTIDKKPSFGGAAAIVLFWWVLYVAGKLGITALFS